MRFRTKVTAEAVDEPKQKFDLSKVQARVDSIKVDGLKRTYDDYVLRTGNDLFKANNFEDMMTEAMSARNYLLSLGVFKDVQIKVDVSHGEKATPHGYEITFKGEEYGGVKASIGTETGQNSGSISSKLWWPNLFGRGERISLDGGYSSTHASDMSINFWKPLYHTKFMPYRPEINASIFRRMDRFDLREFKNSNLGLLANFTISSLFPVELTHTLEYETAIREVTLTSKKAPFVVRESCGPKLSSLIRYNVGFDNRDNNIFATEGIKLRSKNEYCGFGGNVNYMSSEGFAEVNYALFGGLVAQVCGSFGIIQPLKKKEKTLPISNLYLSGGPDKIRGFLQGGAGPVVQNTPMGVATYWCAGLHLWSPIPFNSVFKGLTNNLRMHLFYNEGNDRFSLENTRRSCGIGLALKIASLARFEVNYCIPIRKLTGDKFVPAFQYGFGIEFV